MTSIVMPARLRDSLEWRLYRDMLATRLFEEACVRWEHEGKMAAQVFPSRGQEAIAVGACLALEEGDRVIPSFRTRGAMIAMGVPIVDQLREIIHSPMAAGESRDAPHHSSWPERGVMPGSTMIGGHLPLAAGLALAMQMEGQSAVSVAFFGDGTLGSGDLHETMNIAPMWRLPLVLVCENNGWEMATPWDRVRNQRSLTRYAEPFGFAARVVDGNDAWDVYHSTRWARASALAGEPALLDCMTFRSGTYSSHFGETRPGIEQELADWETRDPLKVTGEWLMKHRAASEADLKAVADEQRELIDEALKQASAEKEGR